MYKIKNYLRKKKLKNKKKKKIIIVILTFNSRYISILYNQKVQYNIVKILLVKLRVIKIFLYKWSSK